MDPKRITGAVTQTLASYFRERGDDRMVESVNPAKPSINALYSYSENIFFNPALLMATALQVRSAGPCYLRSMSISEVAEKLRELVRDNYWRIAETLRHAKPVGPISAAITVHELTLLEAEFRRVFIEPESKLFLFPITPLQVDVPFRSEVLFLSPPCALPELLPVRVDRPDRMPPFARDTVFQGQAVGGWLGIRAPATEYAMKLKRVVLGALALSIFERERHQLTLRDNCSGYCRFDDKILSCSSAPHAPPIGHSAVIGHESAPWLTALTAMITDESNGNEKGLNALEYYFRAWGLEPADRCPIFFAALEALFAGIPSDPATDAITTGIQSTLSNQADPARLKQILRIRGDIVHGRSPDVYWYKSYASYFRRFAADPITDLELLTELCIRTSVFGNSMPEPRDPYADVIARQQGFGLLPTAPISKSIVQSVVSQTSRLAADV
jgi:hypothetical protein